MNAKIRSITRRYDLDWLRVITILVVFCFHSTRFFNLDDWHVKNPVVYASIQMFVKYLDVWMMPLLFFISGMSLYYALQMGKVGKFIKDKIMRLLVPLLVGIFTASILQVYLERITHDQFNGSFFAFLPHYFEGLYSFGGNFAFAGMHLWYLLVLFVFSIALLPLFLILKTKIGSLLLGKLCDLLSLPGAVYLLALTNILYWKSLDPDSPLGISLTAWPFGVYLSILITGFIVASHEKLHDSLRKLRWLSFAGVLAFSYTVITTSEHTDLLAWAVILAAIGFSKQHLNFNAPFLKYANEAVLPFYILHQTVLLSVGFFVVRWAIPDPLKWLIIASTSFATIMMIYEYLVRRSNGLRFLFGMKLLGKQPAPSVAPVPEARQA